MLHLLFPARCHALAFLQVASKRSPSPDLTWTNETFSASQYKMLPFMSIRRQLQTKGLSDSISSNIWLRFWVLTVCFWDLLQQLFACTEWDVNLSRLQSDHMIKLGHIAIAPANMTETMVSPKTLDIQLATAGAKNSASRWKALLFPDWCHVLAFLQAGSKRSPSPDLTWTNETFPASQYKMLPFSR